MDGQACVFYGAAEFSRDLDLLIPTDSTNLAKLMTAFKTLDAKVIAVPELEQTRLMRGHAVHLRCGREDVAGLRIDLMSSLRGVADFEELWGRRTTVEIVGEPIDLPAIEELRTPELLVEVAAAHPALAGDEGALRPAVHAAQFAGPDAVSEALETEEQEERRKDREYWEPLKRELEELGMGQRRR
jgi:hypothetical protein